MALRVALIAVRTSLFEGETGLESRRKHERFLNEIVELFDEDFEFVVQEIVDSQERALEVANLLKDSEVALIVPLAAAPPLWASTAVPKEMPTVLWDITSGQTVPIAAGQAVAHLETSSIGTIMTGGGLRLSGHNFVVVSSPVNGDLIDVKEALELAGVASHMRSTRVLRIGETINGYSTLQIDQTYLDALGMHVDDLQVDELVAGMTASEAQADAESRSSALVSILEKYALEHKADALAINCHGPMFRESDEVGVVACLAASRGLPTSCTADVPTAWVLALMKELTGSALYCEPYTTVDSTESVLLANCGVGQESMSRQGSWREIPSQYYPGRMGRGTSIAMSVSPGPATYIAICPSQERWVLLVFEGEVLDEELPEFGGGHAFFLPNFMSAREMVMTLASVGSVHHGALGLGHVGVKIQKLAAEYLPLNVISL